MAGLVFIFDVVGYANVAVVFYAFEDCCKYVIYFFFEGKILRHGLRAKFYIQIDGFE